jgi:glyoxylate reductase
MPSGPASPSRRRQGRLDCTRTSQAGHQRTAPEATSNAAVSHNARALARCFVTRRLPGPALERLAETHEVEIWPERLPPPYDELRRRTANADGLLALLTDRVDQTLLDGAPKLRAIANYAVGYDNIDLAATRARGILVGNTPDVLTDATADLAFALLLAAARGLPAAIESVRAGDWLTWEPAGYLGYDVHRATLGIIGMGRIGQAVARRAQGFEMTVLHTGREGATPLKELLERSDFVSIHCPLTPTTRHLIDAAALALMKPTAILINTARGPIVDQAALLQALRDGIIGGAALDVTDPEPPAAGERFDAPNLIVVPHIGSATHRARERMAMLAVENLLAGLAGEPMPHPVT